MPKPPQKKQKLFLLTQAPCRPRNASSSFREGVKFYETQSFQALHTEWREKLKENGFVDQEDAKGRLKYKNERTQAFQNGEMILNFFLRLDDFLRQNFELSPIERHILTLYSEGVYHNEIARRVGRSIRYIHKVLSYYRKVI